MVFQSGALFDSLTVGENVGFLLYEHSDLPEPRIKARLLLHSPTASTRPAGHWRSATTNPRAWRVA